MNILIFSKHFWPENFRINMVAEYLSKKTSVKVISENPTYHNRKVKVKNLHKYKNISIARFKTFPRFNNNLFSIFLNYFTYCLIGSIRVIFSPPQNVDIVFVYATSPIFQCIPAIIYSKINKKPLVLWVQDLWPEVLQDLNIIKNKFLIFLLRKIISYLYNSCDCIMVQSNSFKKEIKKYTKKKIYLLFNPEIKKKVKFNKKKKKKFIIVFGGNLGNAQSLITLIEALKKVKKDIFVKIYGDGSQKSLLINALKKNNLEKKCKLYKPISQKKFFSVLKNSNASLITLKKGMALEKTLPAKLQTYLSVGNPIITSADGELFEFIKKNRLGYATHAENSDELAKSINKIKYLSLTNRKFFFDNANKVFDEKFEITSWTESLFSYMNNLYKINKKIN